MTHARDVILRFLRRVAGARRKRRILARLLAASTLLAALTVVSLVALALAPGLREWAVLGLLSVALVGLGLVLAPLVQPDGPRRTAAWMARLDAGKGGALADAQEFSERLELGEPIPTGSSTLARAHVRRVARGLSAEDPALPARRALPDLGARWLGVAVVAALVAALALPRARTLLLLGVASPGAPDVVSHGPVELTYHFPAYLRRPARTELGTGDVRAPVGTHVRVAVEADRELSGARLVVEGAGATDMELAGRRAEGRLVVVRDGTYRIELLGAEGAADPNPPVHVVQAVADEVPRVRLRSPASDVVLGPGEPLDLQWRATDDHGVVEVVARLETEAAEASAADGDTGAHRRLGSWDPPAPSRSGLTTLTPADLGLGGGGEAWLWLEARDDDLVTGPKWGRSRRIRVAVRSREEAEEVLDDLREVLAERLLATLAVLLVDAPPRLPEAADLVASYWRFAESLDSALDVVPAVLRQLEAGTEADLEAWSAVEDMEARLRSLRRTRRRRAEPAARAGDAGRLRLALEDLHPADVEELESAVLLFDMWADRRAAFRALDEGSALEDAARRVHEQLVAASEELALDEEQREALEAALAEVERASEATAESMRELSRAVPGARPTPADQAEARQALADRLQELRDALADGDLERAREIAEELRREADALSRMARSLADMAAMGDPELARRVREVLDQLRSLRRRQADLRDRTNQLRDAARDGVSAEDRQALDEMFRELIALTDEAIELEERGERAVGDSPELQGYFQRLEERARLGTRLAELDRSRESRPGGLTFEERHEYDRLRERLEDVLMAEHFTGGDVDALMRLAQHSREHLGRLRQTLAERDAAGARQPARLSLSQLQRLAGELAGAGEGRLERHAPPFQAAAARVAEVLDRLDELEARMRQASSEALTSAQREQLAELGALQAALEEEARALARRLRELGADAPFLQSGVGQPLGQAAGHMRGAEGRLEGGRPGEASEEQGEALARLREAAEALQPSEGSRRRSGGDREGRTGTRLGDEVEIPDADAYRVPREFREEILEAMRESSAPDGYEQQVREYYRRLVE